MLQWFVTPKHKAGEGRREGGSGVTALAASPAVVLLLQSSAWQGHTEQSGTFANVALAATHGSSKPCTPGAERHPGQQGTGISTWERVPWSHRQGHLHHPGFDCTKSTHTQSAITLDPFFPLGKE